MTQTIKEGKKAERVMKRKEVKTTRRSRKKEEEIKERAEKPKEKTQRKKVDKKATKVKEKKAEKKRPKKPEEEKPKKTKEEKPGKEGKSKKEKKEKAIEKIKFHGKKVLKGEEKTRMSETFMNKKKKPRFVRQESTKLKRLKDKWRRPRGIDSKKHEEKRGKGKIPKIGYKKPNYLRGIHPSGYYPVLIHNVVELSTINPKKEAAIIASSIGRKKRNEIIRIANEKKITILNPRKGEK